MLLRQHAVVLPAGHHADLTGLKAITNPAAFHLKLTVRGSGDLLFAPLGMEMSCT